MFRPCVQNSRAALEHRTLLSNLPAGFTETTIASGFSYPESMTIAPDGRIFVTQHDGLIYVVKDGRALPEPFVKLEVENTSSQGLMSIAFDPQFPEKPFVYVYYVTTQGGAMRNRLSRLTVDGDVTVPSSERMLYQSEPFQIPAGVPAHNGGNIAFGPDGKIYISTGDMLNSNHAQQLTNTFGKILRLNPDGSIPKDNPFYRRTRGLARAIWAYGLRNPFTITFQPGTDRFYINDVGNAAWEEINLGVKGANYGWPQSEGMTKLPGIRAPIYVYSHTQNGQHVDAAIIGGAFYNPTSPSFPSAYLGKYFFSDYDGGWIRMLDPTTKIATDFATDLPHGIVDVDLDAQGRLYYLTIDDGAVHVIQYAPEQPPSLSQPLSDVTAPLGQPVTFQVSPTGSYPFTYQWLCNDQDIPGATSASLTVASDQIRESDTYRVVIANPYGSIQSNEARARSSNDAAPLAKIVGPRNGKAFRIGQIVQFTGVGFDAEAPGGRLPASAFRWQLDLLHNGHVHPNTFVLSGKMAGSFKVPRHDEPGHFSLRLTLTVTDSIGQTASDSVIIETGRVGTKANRQRGLR